MQFFLDKESLNIKFTWRERFKVLFFGLTKLRKKEAYTFSSVLMHVLTQTIKKVGGVETHGQLPRDEHIID